MTEAASRRRSDTTILSPWNRVSENWRNAGEGSCDATYRGCGLQSDDRQGVPARPDSSPERKVRGNRLRQHARSSGARGVVEWCAFSTCTHRTSNRADEGSGGLMADDVAVATRTV